MHINAWKMVRSLAKLFNSIVFMLGTGSVAQIVEHLLCKFKPQSCPKQLHAYFTQDTCHFIAHILYWHHKFLGEDEMRLCVQSTKPTASHLGHSFDSLPW
jgi:hypothetical protein